MLRCWERDNPPKTWAGRDPLHGAKTRHSLREYLHAWRRRGQDATGKTPEQLVAAVMRTSTTRPLTSGQVSEEKTAGPRGRTRARVSAMRGCSRERLRRAGVNRSATRSA